MKKFLAFIIPAFFFTANIQAQQCTLLKITPSNPTITCLSSSPCITLRGNLMDGVTNETNAYAIQANTPCPLPPANNGNPTTISTDDQWSQLITLPFTFYYFGQAYNQLIIGDNGVVSFDTNRTSPQIQRPNDYCAWSFSDSAPSTNLFRNTIFGAYHDLYIPAGGQIVYYVSGTYPERQFVIDFQNVAQYSCNSLRTSQRIILYETSNVIDVQINDKPVCSGWNGGRALIAIQDQTGTQAYVPSGRNTGAWGASNELWRFVPDGTPLTSRVEYAWYDSANNLLGTADTLQVCPTTTSDYRLDVTIYRPADTVFVSKTVTVNVDYSHDNVDLGADQQMCPGDTLSLDATVNNATAYQWQKDGVDIPGATSATYNVTESGTYTVIVDIGLCSTTDDITVTYLDYPQIDLGPDIVACEGDTVTLDATPSNQTGNEYYEWQRDGQIISGANAPTLDVTQTGTYVVTVNEPNMCAITDTVYVYFEPMPDLSIGENQIVCSYETATVSANITDGDSYEWTVNGNIVNTSDTEIQISGTGEYDISLTMQKGPCAVTATTHVTVLEPLVINPNPVLYGELEVNVTGGLPDYSYSVDGNNFQSNNYFTGLPDGDYTVYVVDANGCEADTTVHVTNLIVPAYFSPNNDGIQDTWRIINSELMPGSILYIYDRYGRLIKSFGTEISNYWDGTYNGKAILSDDYWYVLILPNGKIYKGHFSLIR